MPVPWLRALAVTVSILSIPVLFFGCFYAHIVCDEYLGSIEVSNFIQDHGSLVSERLKDPKVHAFWLSHAPNDESTLLISVDVADRATYEMLENELVEFWKLRFPPIWNIHIRSREEPGKNYGYACAGIGELCEGIEWMTRSMILALVIPGVSLFIALSRIRERPRKRRDVDKILS